MNILNETRTGVWIGRDVHLTRSYTVEPRSMLEVSVDVGRIRRENPPSCYEHPDLWSSTRSHLAQRGGEFPVEIDETLKEALKDEKVDTVEVPFLNHSYVSIPLDKNKGGVFRVLAGQGPSLIGQRLNKALTTGEIYVTGKKEKDWWLVHNEREPVGIGLYITNEQWLPPTVKSIKSTGETTKTFRDDMSEHLEAIEEGDLAIIKIGHTVDLYSDSYLAVIDPSINGINRANTRNVTSRHINSRALYPGYPPEPWRIKTETLSGPDELPHRTDLPQRAIIVSFHPIRNPLPYIPS